MPFIQEYLKTSSKICTDNEGQRMHCPYPTKIRLKWVESGSFEEMCILDFNWKMIRPTYCCIQPDMLD